MTTFTPLPYFEDAFEAFAERQLLVRAHTGDTERWRCLVCLTGGSGSPRACDLGIAAHHVSCIGDLSLAAARSDLLAAIGDASQAAYFAAWMTGIERTLLARGGMWELLARAVGWPVGYLGLDGWDTSYQQAVARLTPDPLTASKETRP